MARMKFGVGLQVARHSRRNVVDGQKFNARAENAVVGHGREDEHHPEREQPDNGQAEPVQGMQRRSERSRRWICDCGSHFGSRPSQRLRSEIAIGQGLPSCRRWPRHSRSSARRSPGDTGSRPSVSVPPPGPPLIGDQEGLGEELHGADHRQHHAKEDDRV